MSNEKQDLVVFSGPEFASIIFDETFSDASREQIRKRHREDEEYRNKHIVLRILQFIGFPVDPYDDRIEQFPSVTAYVFACLAGWHHADSPEWQKNLNKTGIKPFLFTLFNLAAIPFKLALNLAKLLLVYLPILTGEALILPARKMIDDIPHASWPGKILLGLGLLGMYCILIPCTVVGFISKLLLSPAKSVKQLWESGNYVPAVIAAVFAASVYMLAFALTFYVVGPILLAKVGANFPAALTTAIHSTYSVISAIGNAMAPVCQYLGSHLIGAITSALGVTAIESGIGQLIGLAALLIGSAVSLMIEKVGNRYHALKKDVVQPLKESIQEDLSDSQVDNSNRKINRLIKERTKSTVPQRKKEKSEHILDLSESDSEEENGQQNLEFGRTFGIPKETPLNPSIKSDVTPNLDDRSTTFDL